MKITDQNSGQAFSYAPDLRPGFVAHMANRLDALICAQTKEILEAAEVKTPVHSVSVMLHLLRQGPASIADIARSQERSHQLIVSRVAPLEKSGLVKMETDPEDERRKILSFTRAGAIDARKAERVSLKIAASFTDLHEELGVDLMAFLERAEQLLRQKPLAVRNAAPAKRVRRKASTRAA